MRLLLHHSVVCLLLGPSTSRNAEDAAGKTEATWKRVQEFLIEHTDDAMRRALQNRDAGVRLKSAIEYLKEISGMSSNDFVSQCSHTSFVPFVIRCTKKSVTKMYNLAVSGKLTGSSEVQDLVIARYDCSLWYDLSIRKHTEHEGVVLGRVTPASTKSRKASRRSGPVATFLKMTQQTLRR